MDSLDNRRFYIQNYSFLMLGFLIDDEEFGWYVPDKLPNKPQNKFEQRDMNMQMQRDMDIRETDKRTKI